MQAAMNDDVEMVKRNAGTGRNYEECRCPEGVAQNGRQSKHPGQRLQDTAFVGRRARESGCGADATQKQRPTRIWRQ